MITTARPRFRTDLVAEPIEEGGHRYIDVVDPDTGNGFRFYDVEYSLACAMDGERDVAGLVVWAKEELGIEPSSGELAQVINTLGDLGYLASAEGTGETELARGVVSHASGRAAAGGGHVEDVELGFGGAQPAGHEAPLPSADFELGTAGGHAPPYGGHAPGGGSELGAAGSREIVMEFEAPTPPPAETPFASMRPTTRPDIEDDGPTNLPGPSTAADFDDDEVSVDLSDHLAISASDVKEAVRASKVMKAVDLPPDLAAQLESNDRDLATARDAAERAAGERAQREADVERERAALERAERIAAERAAAEASRAPVELPKQPPVGVSRPKPTPERQVEQAPPVAAREQPAQPRGNGLLLFLLLVLIAAAGLAVYWYVVEKHPLPWAKKADDPATGSTGGTAVATGPVGGTAVQPPVPPTPPPPPPPPSATLAETAAPASEVTAGQVGFVAFVAADGSTVASGDPLVRFNGNPAWDQKLKGLDYDIDIRVPKQLADATKARAAAQAAGRAAAVKAQDAIIAERTKRLSEKNTERDAIHAAQEALTVKAPAGGVVAMKVAKGARTKAAQVVAVVTPAAQLQAQFTIPEGGKVPAQDASVLVAVKAAPETKANCTVTTVEGAKVTVTCPSDAGIAAATEIILE